MRIIKIVLSAILMFILAPILILALVPPSAPSHLQQSEYETLGVLLERIDYRDKPTTAVEYESNVFRGWGGMGTKAYFSNLETTLRET